MRKATLILARICIRRTLSRICLIWQRFNGSPPLPILIHLVCSRFHPAELGLGAHRGQGESRSRPMLKEGVVLYMLRILLPG